jgi:biopolymer transport protein ExbD
VTTEPTGDALPADLNAFDVRATGRKRRRKVKLEGEDITGLNLTAMMDMMTILLVFLVKSYTTDPERINSSDKLMPPRSSATEELKPAVTIMVSTEGLMVEDKLVKRMDDLTVEQVNKARIPELEDALTTRVEELKRLEQMGGRPFDGSLLVVADKNTPYNILTAVLYTAGQAQFSNYRLLVQKK